MKENNSVMESKYKLMIIDFLINIPLFNQIKADELSIVARYMNYIELDRNEILFKEGDVAPVGAVLVVLSVDGKVQSDGFQSNVSTADEVLLQNWEKVDQLERCPSLTTLPDQLPLWHIQNQH